MIITEEYLKSIRPEIKGESDKYSWNIYRYLKRNVGNDIRVFKSTDDIEVIGHRYQDGVSGCDLDSLIRGPKILEYWFDDNWNLKEITGWLEEYQRIGSRCNWCGQWRHRELHKVVKREIREEWSDDQ